MKAWEILFFAILAFSVFSICAMPVFIFNRIANAPQQGITRPTLVFNLDMPEEQWVMIESGDKKICVRMSVE